MRKQRSPHEADCAGEIPEMKGVAARYFCQVRFL